MLIACPECGKQVSDQAVSCPHCGYVLKKKKERPLIMEYDKKIMRAKTAKDALSIEVADDMFGDLLVSNDGRVWNSGGQIVGEVEFID